MILKVSSRSQPQAVAGAVAAELRQAHVVTVQAVGAGAVNQAVKALAIAGDYLRKERRALAARPGLRVIEIDGAERTAVYFEVWLV